MKKRKMERRLAAARRFAEQDRERIRDLTRQLASARNRITNLSKDRDELRSLVERQRVAHAAAIATALEMIADAEQSEADLARLVESAERQRAFMMLRFEQTAVARVEAEAKVDDLRRRLAGLALAVLAVLPAD